MSNPVFIFLKLSYKIVEYFTSKLYMTKFCFFIMWLLSVIAWANTCFNVINQGSKVIIIGCCLRFKENRKWLNQHLLGLTDLDVGHPFYFGSDVKSQKSHLMKYIQYMLQCHIVTYQMVKISKYITVCHVWDVALELAVENALLAAVVICFTKISVTVWNVLL